MKNRALPYPLFSLRGFKTFRPSVREKVFCRIITLTLSFKERNVLVLILCCYLYYYLP